MSPGSSIPPSAEEEEVIRKLFEGLRQKVVVLTAGFRSRVVERSLQEKSFPQEVRPDHVVGQLLVQSANVLSSCVRGLFGGARSAESSTSKPDEPARGSGGGGHDEPVPSDDLPAHEPSERS